MSNHFTILILGAGSGGVSVASRLRKILGPEAPIGILDPADTHYYQPLWTLVGGGVVSKESTGKPMKQLIPSGVTWVKDSVSRVEPHANQVILASGKIVSYDFLIIGTGLKLDWSKIKGVEGEIGKNGVCSIYQFEKLETTFEMLNSFQGGDAIFTMPPVPIKCAGAPQKIMYLADELFRKNGVRAKSRVIFATAGKVIFGVPVFAKALLKVVDRKKIELRFSEKLVELKAAEKKAVFERTTEYLVNNAPETKTELVEVHYDLLHVVPPMSAHAYVADSGLAFTEGAHKGWLKVNQLTLQHEDYMNIFGIGDVTGVPNSKTGAAIRKQAPVVVKNLLDTLHRRPLSAKYDGYSSCPLVTGVGKVILAEFGYDGKLLPS